MKKKSRCCSCLIRVGIAVLLGGLIWLGGTCPIGEQRYAGVTPAAEQAA